MSDDYTPIPIEPFVPTVLQREWGTETIIGATSEYLGKVLHYRAGKAGGLQLHREKIETFHLLKGTAWVDYDDGGGTLKRTRMKPGESLHIPAGAVHRFVAIVDCLVLEVSTPVYEDRVRMEEHYGVAVIGKGPGLPTTDAPRRVSVPSDDQS